MKIQSRYVATLENLGPYCAELYLYSDMKHRVTQLLSHPENIGTQDVDMESSQQHVAIAAQQLLELHYIICEYAPFFDDPLSPINLSHCTPKVSELISVLLSHVASCSDQLRGIIFVEQRQVASCLAKILPNIQELKERDIRCAELVGQGSDSGIVNGRGQRGVVKAFRDGEINLGQRCFHLA
jgi:endoribonuclease Dicer